MKIVSKRVIKNLHLHFLVSVITLGLIIIFACGGGDDDAIVPNPGLRDNISPDGQDAFSPQVAMDDNGDAIITWEQSHDSSIWQIFMSEYRNGTWTHPNNLNDNISTDGLNATSPQVAMDDNSDAIIAWGQWDGSNNRIFKSEYRNGAWTHPSKLSDNISPDGQSASSPQVAMDVNGDAIITWEQWDGSNLQIFMSEYRNGVWTHPSGLNDHINPNGILGAFVPQVAMDDNSDAIITWVQGDHTGKWQIFMSEYRNGAWTHPNWRTDKISPDGQNASRPQVAMGNNGDAIITWDQSDGTNLQIFMMEYR